MRHSLIISVGLITGLIANGFAEEYRFPAIHQDRINLAGTWKIRADPDNIGLQEKYERPDFIDDTWQSLRVPGVWEEQPIGLETYDGIVWHRKRMVIPEEWNRFDLEIDLGKVDDAATCFFNGSRVGQTRHIEEVNRFVVPSAIVQYGSPNVLAVRIEDFGYSGGINPGPVEIRPVLPWNDLPIFFSSTDGTFVYRENQTIEFSFRIKNILKGDLSGKLAIRISSMDGKLVFEKDIPIRLKEEQTTSFKEKRETLPKGYYNVAIELKGKLLVLKKKQSSFVVLGAPIEFEDPMNSPFGLSGGALFHIPIETHPTQGDLRLRQIDQLGVRWGRNSIWWNAIYRQQGKYDWKKADSVISYFRKNRIQLLGILNSSTDPLTGRPPVTEKGRQAFGEYVYELVNRYKDTVQHWEVWNEPNIPHFWQFEPNPDQYMELLKTTSKAVKRADSNAKVVGGVTSGTDLDFIEAILKRGAADQMDIVCVHPYQVNAPGISHPADQLHKTPALRKLLNRYGGEEIAIWMSECGWPTIGDFNETRQVEYLVKYFTSVLGEGLVEKVYWFNLDDWGPKGSSIGGHWGLTYMDHSPKPSFLAYFVLMETLANYQSAEPWNPHAPDIQGYLFKQKDRSVYVVWSLKGSQKITPPRDCTMQIDVYGQVSSISIDQISEGIEIGTMPVYLITTEKPN